MNQLANMNELIYDYQPYILNENNMNNYLKYKFIENNQNNDKYIDKKYDENLLKSKPKQSIFIPKEQDTLFWCYFIIKNGDIKYETINNKNPVITKQIKIDYVKLIRENKQIIKTYKFDTISNIESNLANDNIINIKTIMSLCAIGNINLIFVNNKTYYELLMNENDYIYIIHEISMHSKYVKKYGYEIASKEILNNIRSNLYKLDTLNKPIKTLSSYKVQDLIDISNKLAIEVINTETGKNKTKNELYESIIQYF